MTERETNEAASRAMGWWEPGQFEYCGGQFVGGVCVRCGSAIPQSYKDDDRCFAGLEIPPPDWSTWETFGRALMELGKYCTEHRVYYDRTFEGYQAYLQYDNGDWNFSEWVADPRIALRDAVIAMGEKKNA